MVLWAPQPSNLVSVRYKMLENQSVWDMEFGSEEDNLTFVLETSNNFAVMT